MSKARPRREWTELGGREAPADGARAGERRAPQASIHMTRTAWKTLPLRLSGFVFKMLIPGPSPDAQTQRLWAEWTEDLYFNKLCGQFCQ